jgi:hypothetical protein
MEQSSCFAQSRDARAHRLEGALLRLGHLRRGTGCWAWLVSCCSPATAHAPALQPAEYVEGQRDDVSFEPSGLARCGRGFVHLGLEVGLEGRARMGFLGRQIGSVLAEKHSAQSVRGREILSTCWT